MRLPRIVAAALIAATSEADAGPVGWTAVDLSVAWPSGTDGNNSQLQPGINRTGWHRARPHNDLAAGPAIANPRATSAIWHKPGASFGERLGFGLLGYDAGAANYSPRRRAVELFKNRNGTLSIANGSFRWPSDHGSVGSERYTLVRWNVAVDSFWNRFP